MPECVDLPKIIRFGCLKTLYWLNRRKTSALQRGLYQDSSNGVPMKLTAFWISRSTAMPPYELSLNDLPLDFLLDLPIVAVVMIVETLETSC